MWTLIFVGIFCTVLLVMAAAIAIALWRGLRDLGANRTEKIRWHADFEDLPPSERSCRHELTGEFRERSCELAFDCRHCEMHAKLAARGGTPPADSDVFGLDMPLDRYYHRGHTWAHFEPSGTVIVGLDDLAQRAFGQPDRIELPPAGARLEVNGTAWKMWRDGLAVRVLSPVEGEVVATGSNEDGWLLRVLPAHTFSTRHLLTGAEVRPWIQRELDKLQLALSPSASLADGGVLVADLPASQPGADWDSVWGKLFLHP
jgi:hypothetical protein